MNLQEENKRLQQQLALSKAFIEREILTHKKMISSQKISFETETKTDNFFKTDNEQLIRNSLEQYFGEDLLYLLSGEFISHLVSAELVFYTVGNTKTADGFSVLSSYMKAIDVFIEQEITKPFRKFAVKEHMKLLQNDVLEKNLHRVIYKGHSLSFGRLFQLLTVYPEDIKSGTYLETFYRFLEKYDYIGTVLCKKQFLELYRQIQQTEVTSTARHQGSIDFETTKYVRNLLIGNMENRESFLYKLVQVIEIVG